MMPKRTTSRFIGIDVQTNRGCPYVVLDPVGDVETTGWLSNDDENDVPGQALQLVTNWSHRARVQIGIDAPRQPMPEPRRWQCRDNRWERLPPEDGKRGRHCELVLSSLGIANPQWTPLESDARNWMKLGFDLYRRLNSTDAGVYEVFPTASYEMLARTDESLSVELPYADLQVGVKDLVDAYVGAETVRCFSLKEGTEVGGCDGLGTIILPTPLRAEERNHPVHRWPREDAE